MRTDEFIMAVAVALMLSWPIYAWIAEDKRRRTVDGWGKVFGMQRWPHESNRDFARRILDRQRAGGGRW